MSDPWKADLPIREDNIINESERSVDPADDEYKLVKLEKDGRLSPTFQNPREFDFLIPLDSYDFFDGTSTPVPVLLEGEEGTVVQSSANTTGRQSFFGFTKSETINSLRVHSQQTTETSVSVTIPAGEDLFLAVIAFTRGSGGSPTLPSAVSWGSESLDLIESNSSQPLSKIACFGKEVGTKLTPETETLSTTSFSGSDKSLHIVVYQKINQSTPVTDSSISANSSVTSLSTASISINNPVSFLIASASSNQSTTTLSGEEILNTGTHTKTSELTSASARTITATASGSGTIAVAGFSLNTTISAKQPAVIQWGNVVSGFSGLTSGSEYFVQNTTGEIDTTAGDTSIKVGVAISDTEILIEK